MEWKKLSEVKPVLGEPIITFSKGDRLMSVVTANLYGRRGSLGFMPVGFFGEDKVMHEWYFDLSNDELYWTELPEPPITDAL